MNAAERQRRRRARQRSGRRIVPVEVDEVEAEYVLARLGYITAGADDPKTIERGLSALLSRLFDRVTRDAADV